MFHQVERHPKIESLTFENCGLNTETNPKPPWNSSGSKITSLSISNLSFLRQDLLSRFTEIRSLKLRLPDVGSVFQDQLLSRQFRDFLCECRCLESLDLRGFFDLDVPLLLGTIGKNLISLRIAEANLRPEILSLHCPKLRKIGIDIQAIHQWVDCVCCPCL